MKTIPLTHGYVTVVDDADYLHLSQWKWHAASAGKARRVYARRDDYSTGHQRHVWMHREILGAPPQVQIDHRDGDGLNNQRFNLRYATLTQNMQNKPRYRSNTSGFKGVVRRGARWRSRISVNGKRLHLGWFKSPEEAHEAYVAAAKLHFGSFARSE